MQHNPQIPETECPKCEKDKNKHCNKGMATAVYETGLEGYFVIKL